MPVSGARRYGEKVKSASSESAASSSRFKNRSVRIFRIIRLGGGGFTNLPTLECGIRLKKILMKKQEILDPTNEAEVELAALEYSKANLSFFVG